MNMWNFGVHVVFFSESVSKLGGGFKKKSHPYLGKISNLTNIFQMGWNDHLVRNINFFIQRVPTKLGFFVPC